ncbi:VanZ family protein [Corynebacterium sp. DNF00584]|uniref:VanZ family protein n=1 Tax=Corynebacterium sp. DNF00584 TaxID=1384076 RepID=UPI000ACDE074|nr:VanZ family protein [Corynebacterium sp. DNF00584]
MTVTATKSPAPARHRSVSDHLTVRRDARPVSLLVLAVTAVATVGKPFIEIPGIINASAHRVRSVNLDLFHEWVAGTTIWYGKYTNTFGNIALFIPVGLVLVALAATAVRGRASRLSLWLRAVVIAAGLSVGIEGRSISLRWATAMWTTCSSIPRARQWARARCCALTTSAKPSCCGAWASSLRRCSSSWSVGW